MDEQQLLAQLDRGGLESSLAKILKIAISGFSEGASDADLVAFAQEIAKNRIEAHLNRDEEAIRALNDQADVLLERYRIRFEGWMWPLIQQIVDLLFSAAVTGAIHGAKAALIADKE